MGLLPDDAYVLDAQRAGRAARVVVRGLGGGRCAAPTTEVRECDVTAQACLSDGRGVDETNPSVVGAAGESDEVAGEPVPADVRGLPHELGVAGSERGRERPTLDGATGVASAMRTHKEQWLRERNTDARPDAVRARFQIGRSQVADRAEREPAWAVCPGEEAGAGGPAAGSRTPDELDPDAVRGRCLDQTLHACRKAGW